MDDNAFKNDAGEKQNVIGLGFCGPSAGSNTSVVEEKDGKLIRIRPLHFDSKYERESLNPWRMEVRGKVLEPPMKSLIPPYSQGYKKRVYSSNRVLYPLKRVDWTERDRSNGEAQPAEPRRQQVPAHLLGGGARHRREPRSGASTIRTGPSPFCRSGVVTARPKWSTIRMAIRMRSSA